MLTNESIYTFDGKNLEKILEIKNTQMNYLSKLDVSNILIKEDLLYIGLNRQIAIIDLNTKNIEYKK